MCIAYPAHVLAVHDDGTAIVDLLGRDAPGQPDGPRQQVLLALVDAGPPICAGDWLLVQTGLALERLDEAEAAARIRLINEAAAARPEQPPSPGGGVL